MNNTKGKKGKGKAKAKAMGGNLDVRAKRRASMGAIAQSDSSIGNKYSKARKARENKRGK